MKVADPLFPWTLADPAYCFESASQDHVMFLRDFLRRALSISFPTTACSNRGVIATARSQQFTFRIKAGDHGVDPSNIEWIGVVRHLVNKCWIDRCLDPYCSWDIDTLSYTHWRDQEAIRLGVVYIRVSVFIVQRNPTQEELMRIELLHRIYQKPCPPDTFVSPETFVNMVERLGIGAYVKTKQCQGIIPFLPAEWLKNWSTAIAERWVFTWTIDCSGITARAVWWFVPRDIISPHVHHHPPVIKRPPGL